MTDSPRWCESCKDWGDHHTDRHPRDPKVKRVVVIYEFDDGTWDVDPGTEQGKRRPGNIRAKLNRNGALAVVLEVLFPSPSKLEVRIVDEGDGQDETSA